MSDWETSAHPLIQVRLQSPERGFECRVWSKEGLFDGGIRCEKCGRVFAKAKDDKPWVHKCVNTSGWKTLLRRWVDDDGTWHTEPRLYGTRQLAYAAGARRLDIVNDMGQVIGTGRAA